jgi:hypothetical protein
MVGEGEGGSQGNTVDAHKFMYDLESKLIILVF